MKGNSMRRSLFSLALPALALLSACDSQDNATTQSETATVPGDDGAATAPIYPTDSGAPGSDDSAATTETPPDADKSGQNGPENMQTDDKARAPGPTNPPADDAVPPPAK